MSFSNSLIHWYLQNKRDLPWRNTTDAYTIWLSEIILQQTRVAQGLPYFESFINVFPTVFELARASEEQVLKLWQGLGYYSRARNLHATAKFVVGELNGEFPNSYHELLKLKGIGEYTAAAIASFSANENVAVLDGNVYRILARYFNVHNDISISSTKKVFQELAKEVLPEKDTPIYNQAIMEFGALQCVPKSPNCSVCVLNDSCAALQYKTVDILPIKSKKTKVTNRYFNYIVFEDIEERTIVKQRIEKGIWQNLYEFPVIESKSSLESQELIKLIRQKYSEIKNITVLPTFDIIHKLSHQTLHIQFVKVQISTKIENGISISDLQKLPFPIVIHNFIERYFS
ncbi:A/G-specific adenine glycosylase [uncultured Flavobacterium sp.]|uniref:A/G-specific adenine glycosylase n=1 Tax=uncultured Flavobacterium sp. TaxID=165435 RepID=UPI0030C7D47B